MSKFLKNHSVSLCFSPSIPVYNLSINHLSIHPFILLVSVSLGNLKTVPIFQMRGFPSLSDNPGLSVHTEEWGGRKLEISQEALRTSVGLVNYDIVSVSLGGSISTVMTLIPCSEGG